MDVKCKLLLITMLHCKETSQFVYLEQNPQLFLSYYGEQLFLACFPKIRPVLDSHDDL